MRSLFHLPNWVYHLITFSVWSIVPGSWLYCAYFLTINFSLHHQLTNLLSILPQPSRLLFSYALLELVFSIYYFFRAWTAQKRLHRFNHEPEFMRESLERAARSGLRTQASIDRYPPCDDLKRSSRQAGSQTRINDDQVSSVSSSSGFSSLASSSSTAPSTPPLSPSFGSVTELKPLAWDDPRAVDFRSHQVLWFGNCKYSEIGRENLQEWITWVLFNRPRSKSLRESAEAVLTDQICSLFEARAGAVLPPGYNPRLRTRVIRLTLDPIRVRAHPLALYVATSTVSWTIKQLLFRCEFVERKSGGKLKYLIRKPIGWDDQPVKSRTLPFVFIHGLGLGLIQYTLFLNYLANSSWARARPVMILLQPSISLAFFDRQHLSPPSKEDMTADMTKAIERLGFSETGFEILGHSYGTIVAGWIIKAMGSLVRRVCLIDPVCFCEWEGHVCHNFLYAEPLPGLERLLRYFLATELGIAKTLHRHFDWPANILWPTDLPKSSAVFLAGCDSILDAYRIHTYLKEYGMGDRIVLSPSAAHGQLIFEDKEPFRAIKAWIEGQSISMN
ncbi:hypothetical protein CROQUDRAFT_54126 [Cronartium quercuum f. sp. fusiforme G11]|uniref:AB hydrolase-1 domain-containing protein n=1 Tax=Cronartium quercuum f. sp. fusiforme G11 TaxID=708437 RepID=A0A9P6N6M8_9BASI|nr:hypothetical protein CROQUDRAFT_54126 [Cronartium quercuum f. sp. fusiforme G11]